MAILRNLSIAACLYVTWVTSASAFECSAAATEVEVTICRVPELKALDDALESAYARVRRLSTPEERMMLAKSQKRWIALRESCLRGKSELSACIQSTTSERLKVLEARPESGPGSNRPMMPTFVVQEGSEKSYEIEVLLYRFATPESAAEKIFNSIVSSQIERLRLGPHRLESMGRTYALQQNMTLTFLSPKFLSVLVSQWIDEGGAHGNGMVENFNIDLTTGRILEIADVLSENAAAKLSRECKSQIVAEKKSRVDGEAYDPETDDFLKDDVIGEHIATLSRWSISEREIGISFDAYSIGPYAEGSFECRFALSDVKALALDGSPLP